MNTKRPVRLAGRFFVGELPPMRLLIAPDSFKESLSAHEAAEAIRRGAERAGERLGGEMVCDLCPLSDGGEGFVESISEAIGGQLRATPVEGPLGEPTDALWALLEAPEVHALPKPLRAIGDVFLDLFVPPLGPFKDRYNALDRSREAVIECASCVGLRLIPPGRRNPARASTAGLGQLIARAFDERCASILIGLGGSATCDGGVGVAAALGVRFLDEHGEIIQRPTGADLSRIADIRLETRDQRIDNAALIVACDVDNPLLGDAGAAPVYAPQKGATPEQVDSLASGLEHLLRICERARLPADPTAPGAGAGGGLGFGLATFLNAALVPGARLVLESIGFSERAQEADLVITGEGKLDAQSLAGKTTVSAARAGRERGAPTVALVGGVEPEDASPDDFPDFADVRVVTPPEQNDEQALAQAAENLERVAESLLADALAGRLPGVRPA